MAEPGDIAALLRAAYGDPMLERVAQSRPWPTLPPLPDNRPSLRSYDPQANRPRDAMAPVAETLSPTMGGYGMGELLAQMYGHGKEGDWGRMFADAPWLAAALAPGLRNRLTIHKSPKVGIHGQSFYDAHLDGDFIGRLSVHPDNRVGNVFVDPSARRQGIASELYEHAAKDRSVPKLSPGDYQTPEGRMLRDAYEGNPNWLPYRAPE